MHTLNEKQVARLEQQFEEIRRVHEIPESPFYIDQIRIAYKEEIRPGRGHDIDWFWADGEHVIQGSIDVYGYGEYFIAVMDLVHNGFDEECECPPCSKYRQQEDN